LSKIVGLQPVPDSRKAVGAQMDQTLGQTLVKLSFERIQIHPQFHFLFFISQDENIGSLKNLAPIAIIMVEIGTKSDYLCFFGFCYEF
jgi:hypothetical protein